MLAIWQIYSIVWQVSKQQMLDHTWGPEFHGCITPVLWQPSALNRCPPPQSRRQDKTSANTFSHIRFCYASMYALKSFWAHLVVMSGKISQRLTKVIIFHTRPSIHNQTHPSYDTPSFFSQPLHLTYIRVHNIYSWLFHSQTSIFVTELIWAGRLVHPRSLWKVLELSFTSCKPNK